MMSGGGAFDPPFLPIKARLKTSLYAIHCEAGGGATVTDCTPEGVIRFETVIELVRLPHRDLWKRPAPLPGQPRPGPFAPR